MSGTSSTIPDDLTEGLTTTPPPAPGAPAAGADIGLSAGLVPGPAQVGYGLTPPAPGAPTGPGDAFVQGLGRGTRDVMSGFGLGALANTLGLPVPQTQAQQIISGINTGGAGAMATMVPAAASLKYSGALMNPLQERLATTLAATPIRQAMVGGAAGGVGSTAGMLFPQNPLVGTGAAYGTALLSGLLPGGGGRFRVTPTSPEELADLATQKYKIPIFPGQMGAMKYPFAITGKFPGSGYTGAMEGQQAAFNRAVGNTFGANTVNGKLTPEAMTAARDANSGAWANIAKNTSVNFATDPLNSDLQAIETQLASQNAADRQPVQSAIDAVREQGNNPQNNNTLGGGWLQNQLNAKSTISAGAGGSSVVKPQWVALKQALQDAVERNSSPADYADLQQAKQNWLNMKTVEPLVAKGFGDVSPALLPNAVATNRFQRTAYTGGGDLAELGQIGRQFIKPVPESGTPEKLASMTPIMAAAERIMEGDWKGALGVAGTTATTVGLADAANWLMRRGALSPTTPAGYYARVLMNPAMPVAPTQATQFKPF